MKKKLSPSRTSIQPYGQNKSECGYCKSKADTSVSYGIVSERMLASEYDQLMNVGWRRSGTYFYKPNNTMNCCKLYTIRLPVDQFKISKAQRQVMRRFERFLMTGDVHEVPVSSSTTISGNSVADQDITSSANANSTSKSAGSIEGVSPSPVKPAPMYQLVVETEPATYTKEK
jgi:arginine-tRNA-protein transferase